MTLVERLARFLAERPNVWHDGRDLGTIAGSYAWRTRISDLRRPPFNMAIENRQRHVRQPDGTTYTVSEYRFVTTSHECLQAQPVTPAAHDSAGPV
jgi:hypothetical protein